MTDSHTKKDMKGKEEKMEKGKDAHYLGNRDCNYSSHCDLPRVFKKEEPVVPTRIRW